MSKKSMLCLCSPTSMQQRHQAALHAHLVQQRLAAQDAAERQARQQQLEDEQQQHTGQRQQQQAAEGLEDEQQQQAQQRQHEKQQQAQQLHPRQLAGTGSRLLPSHIHAPAGAHYLAEGVQHYRPADHQAAFHSARSLPAHLHQLPEVSSTSSSRRFCSFARDRH